jgi:hypothetical protein
MFCAVGTTTSLNIEPSNRRTEFVHEEPGTYAYSNRTLVSRLLIVASAVPSACLAHSCSTEDGDGTLLRGGGTMLSRKVVGSIPDEVTEFFQFT